MPPLAKALQVVQALLNVGWTDVGNWSALWAIADKDAQGNVAAGVTIYRIPAIVIFMAKIA